MIKLELVLINDQIKFTLLTSWVDHLFIPLCYWAFNPVGLYSLQLIFFKHTLYVLDPLMGFATVTIYLFVSYLLFDFHLPVNLLVNLSA